MERVWITNGSTSIAPIVNPLNAACVDGYRPTNVFVLSNPGISDVVDAATSMMKTIVTASGGNEPTIETTTIEDELDFDAIVAYLQSTIETATAEDASIAIDVSPGRTFWSIISFQAGREYDVDHLYYGYVLSTEYYGVPYPCIPRTAMNLVDFTEVF